MGIPEKEARRDTFHHSLIRTLSPSHTVQGVTFPSTACPHCGFLTAVPSECLQPILSPRKQVQKYRSPTALQGTGHEKGSREGRGLRAAHSPQRKWNPGSWVGWAGKGCIRNLGKTGVAMCRAGEESPSS